MFCFKNVSHSQTRKVHHMESSSLCKIPVVNLVHFTHRPNFYGIRDVGMCATAMKCTVDKVPFMKRFDFTVI